MWFTRLNAVAGLAELSGVVDAYTKCEALGSIPSSMQAKNHRKTKQKPHLAVRHTAVFYVWPVMCQISFYN